MRDLFDTGSVNDGETIGLCAGILAIRANIKCSRTVDFDEGFNEVRFIVAGHCLVFANLVKFTRARRLDLPIEAFSKSLLLGIAKLAITSEGISTYDDLIINDTERRQFREYVFESLKSESAGAGGSGRAAAAPVRLWRPAGQNPPGSRPLRGTGGNRWCCG